MQSDIQRLQRLFEAIEVAPDEIGLNLRLAVLAVLPGAVDVQRTDAIALLQGLMQCGVVANPQIVPKPDQ
jgi:hypothetical protein